MTKLIRARKTFARSFAAALAVAAMAVLAGANTAKAYDQQATSAEMDNYDNQLEARGLSYHDAYARAHSHSRGGFSARHRDFQLEGR